MKALTFVGHFEKKDTKALKQKPRIGKKRGSYSGILYGLSDATGMFPGSLFLYYGVVLIGTGRFGGVIIAMTLLIFGMGRANAALAVMPQISRLVVGEGL